MKSELTMTGSSRRDVLVGGAALTLAALFGTNVPAWATEEEMQSLIDDYTGGATPETGRIKLTAPEIAENGNTVPISVEVDSPMTTDDNVESVMILADLNPRPGVVTFNFTPASGKAQASTRMRLARTQNVVALAKLSDGSIVTDSKNVKVTIGGCGG